MKNNGILKVQILRKASADSESYWQSFEYEIKDPGATVATMLRDLENLDSSAVEGDPVSWECSCLQKAMRRMCHGDKR